MLHEFLDANRAELVKRCDLKVTGRHGPTPREEMEYGVPVFLQQLIETLRNEDGADFPDGHAAARGSLPGSAVVSTDINSGAMKHGYELLLHGYTIEEVIHDYGDLCQAVTELAFEEEVSVSVGEFHTLNRCLDDAIAGAVTGFSRAPDTRVAKAEEATDDHPGFPAHEMRDFLHTAFLSFGAIRSGRFGFGCAAFAALDRSLVGLRDLLDRCLGEAYQGPSTRGQPHEARDGRPPLPSMRPH